MVFPGFIGRDSPSRSPPRLTVMVASFSDQPQTRHRVIARPHRAAGRTEFVAVHIKDGELVVCIGRRHFLGKVLRVGKCFEIVDKRGADASAELVLVKLLSGATAILAAIGDGHRLLFPLKSGRDRGPNEMRWQASVASSCQSSLRETLGCPSGASGSWRSHTAPPWRRNLPPARCR